MLIYDYPNTFNADTQHPMTRSKISADRDSSPSSIPSRISAKLANPLWYSPSWKATTSVFLASLEDEEVPSIVPNQEPEKCDAVAVCCWPRNSESTFRFFSGREYGTLMVNNGRLFFHHTSGAACCGQAAWQDNETPGMNREDSSSWHQEKKPTRSPWLLSVTHVIWKAFNASRDKWRVSQPILVRCSNQLLHLDPLVNSLTFGTAVKHWNETHYQLLDC